MVALALMQVEAELARLQKKHMASGDFCDVLPSASKAAVVVATNMICSQVKLHNDSRAGSTGLLPVQPEGSRIDGDWQRCVVRPDTERRFPGHPELQHVV